MTRQTNRGLLCLLSTVVYGYITSRVLYVLAHPSGVNPGLPQELLGPDIASPYPGLFGFVMVGYGGEFICQNSTGGNVKPTVIGTIATDYAVSFDSYDNIAHFIICPYINKGSVHEVHWQTLDSRNMAEFNVDGSYISPYEPNPLPCTYTFTGATIDMSAISDIFSGTLTPGVYCLFTSAAPNNVLVPSNLVLDFESGPTTYFTFAVRGNVVFSNDVVMTAINAPLGDGPCRTYWIFQSNYLTGGTTIGANANVFGTFYFLNGNFYAGPGSIITGRLASATYGNINLAGGTLTIGLCSTPCINNPCQNGATCSNQNSCACLPHSSGQFCQTCAGNYSTIAGICTANPCFIPRNPCLKGGVCTESPTRAGVFTCACVANYTDASFCSTCSPGYYRPNSNSNCILIDLCNPNPCRIGGVCVQTLTTFVCNCVFPYGGTYCQACRPGWNLTPPNGTCIFGGYNCSPPVAYRVLVNLQQGPTVARPFKLNITHFPFVSNGCTGINAINNTLGAIITSLPTVGYLLVPFGTDAYNIIGVVPYYIVNISAPASQLFFWPTSQLAYGTPPSNFYSQFSYVGVVGTPGAANFRESASALVIINLNATNLPPVATSAIYTISVHSSITITLQGTNPNDVLGRLTIPWLAHGIPSATVISLPINGGMLKRTPTSPTLILANLPVQVGPPSPLYITYVAEDIPLSTINGSNVEIQDSFDFTVSNGVLNSVEPGVITIYSGNPLQFLPSINTTQEIRTQILSQVNLKAANVLYPNAVVEFRIVALPIAGTLYILENGTYVKATSGANGTVNFIGKTYGASQFYYQPFPDTVGLNADYIELRLVNITDGFTSGIGFHYFWIVDPPVWEAPPNQPLQTYVCAIGCAHPLVFSMKLINGDSGNSDGTATLPALVITMTTEYGIGVMTLNHPELANQVTFIIGAMSTPYPIISFQTTRSVANILMTNMSYSTIGNLLQTVTFVARDTDNGTVYTVTNVVKIQGNALVNPSGSSSIFTPLLIGLIFLIIFIPICCLVLVLIFLQRLCGISSALNKEDKQVMQAKKTKTKAKVKAKAKAKATKAAQTKANALKSKKDSQGKSSLLSLNNMRNARSIQERV